MSERLRVVLGSTSDEEKVLPGIIQFTRDYPEREVMVHYASVDNTPDKVQRIAPQIISHGPNVFISGAGMAAILTGFLKTYSKIDDLNIGIPISDSSSGGLTALLSIAEKPPYNPVLAVGINNSYAALNIANRFQNFGFDKAGIISGKSSTEKAGVEKLVEQCQEFEVPFEVQGDLLPGEDSLVLNVYDIIGRAGRNPLVYVDGVLRKGKGIQVVVSCSPINYSYESYLHILDRTYNTGIVSSQGYVNAAQIAAAITKNKGVLDLIAKEKDERADKLRKHNGLEVANGEVVKL